MIHRLLLSDLHHLKPHRQRKPYPPSRKSPLYGCSRSLLPIILSSVAAAIQASLVAAAVITSKAAIFTSSYIATTNNHKKRLMMNNWCNFFMKDQKFQQLSIVWTGHNYLLIILLEIR